MGHTLGTAAKATGISRTAILRAIKSGKISASKNDHGQYDIDPAELHRVYKPVANDVTDSSAVTPQVNDTQHKDNSGLHIEIKVLRERLADKDSVIDDLRTRLDAEAEERRKTQAQLTALLTDQRAKEEPKRRRWFSFGKQQRDG
jgi:predicted site-specific integrase-resolvase